MDKTILNTQIKEALNAHEGWKVKLREAVNTGNLPKPAQEICKDDQCSFGKWLNSLAHDPAVKVNPHYAAVVRAHSAFHREAGRVAGHIEQGQKAIAQDALQGMAFRDATNRLTSAMADWQRNV